MKASCPTSVLTFVISHLFWLLLRKCLVRRIQSFDWNFKVFFFPVARFLFLPVSYGWSPHTEVSLILVEAQRNGKHVALWGGRQGSQKAAYGFYFAFGTVTWFASKNMPGAFKRCYQSLFKSTQFSKLVKLATWVVHTDKPLTQRSMRRCFLVLFICNFHTHKLTIFVWKKCGFCRSVIFQEQM